MELMNVRIDGDDWKRKLDDGRVLMMNEKVERNSYKNGKLHKKYLEK